MNINSKANHLPIHSPGIKTSFAQTPAYTPAQAPVQKVSSVCDDIRKSVEFSRSILYKQFSGQILRMTQAQMEHMEAMHVMVANINDRFMNANVMKMAKDGNCLFASLIHQIHAVKNGSDYHNALTADLRRNVVKYITENLDSFTQAIKLRLSYNGENVQGTCMQFLKEKLSVNGCFGGTETLLAVSKMYGVNILVFREKGPFYFGPGGFNSKFERTIMLAYRIGGFDNDGQPDYNHYDSICGIDENHGER